MSGCASGSRGFGASACFVFFFFFFFFGGGGFGLWDSGLISLALWGLRPETPRQ